MARLLRTRRPTGSFALAALVLWATQVAGPVHAQQRFQIGNTQTSKSPADHSERCIAAVDLAIIAAETGALDVSIEAVRRACQQGPPVASVDLGGILSSRGRSRSPSVSRANQEQAGAAAQTKLAARLCKLHDVWVEREVDPLQAYQAWKELIFPPARPNDAYCYSSQGAMSTSYSYGDISFEAKAPALAPSGAANLAHWADKANQLDDLKAELEKRAPQPGAADTVALMRVILAGHDSAPMEEGEAQCRALAARPSLLVDHPYAELHLGHTLKLMERLGNDSKPSQELMDAILKASTSNQRWAANKWLQYIVAWKLNESIQEGAREDFRRTAQLAMSQYDPIRSGNTEYVASREAALYAEAAKRAFDADQPELGIECLQTLALLPTSSRYGDAGLRGLLDVQNPIMKGLLTMEPAERLKFLNNIVWNMPMLGLNRHAALRPTDYVPSTFVHDDSAAKRRSRITRDDAICYSLLEWAMRESIAQGKQADVEARISELESRGSDDAKLAQFIWNLTQGEPVNLLEFSETDAGGKRTLVPVLGDTTRVSMLDLELMRLTIADDEWREAGLRFLEERLPIAVDKAQLDYVNWMRSLRMDFRRAVGKPVVTHEVLAHWVVGNNPSQHDFRGGRCPRSVWMAQDDGMWNHQCSPYWSYLFLRYPLAGDFSIELHSPDYAWREGAAAVGGLFVEFLRHDGRLLLRAMAERGEHDFKTDAMKFEHLNRYLFESTEGTVKITVGENDFSSVLGDYSSQFPFFTISSLFYRDASFGQFKLTGEPTIPREVDLLSETLQGWTGHWKWAKVPLLKIAPGELAVDSEKSEAEIIEWQFADGELRTVDQVAERARRNAEAKVEAEPFVEKRREAIIQYLRPLCDQEQIDLEFYYEPGKFCLAPSLGRIALLLDEHEVGLHWVTCDNELWTGVATSNRVVDPNAKQLAPVELKENAWNELQLRLEGDTLVLSLNGKAVYRRQWEPEVDRKFGLFHDPTRYHIRVRNVRLSGDWPEKPPADFLERRPGSKI